MYKIIAFFTFFFLVILTSQSQTLVAEHTGCSSFRVDFTGSIIQDLAYYNNINMTCNGAQLPIKGASVKGAQYRLQRKEVNGSYTTLSTNDTNDAYKEYSGLSKGTYRVQLFRRYSSSMPAVPFGLLYSPNITPCSISVAQLYLNGNATLYHSSDIEIGAPEVTFTVSPTPSGNPAKICYSLVDAVNEPININASASYGERAHFIAVFKKTFSGTDVGYASTNWVNGKVGVFNLKNLNMNFEPGYSYTVQLALSQLPCTGWVDAYATFRIDGSCRNIETEARIRVFPNPATDLLNIEGVENWQTSEVTVNLTDILGRNVQSSVMTLPLAPLNLAGLQKGNYLLTISSGEKFFSQKIIVE